MVSAESSNCKTVDDDHVNDHDDDDGEQYRGEALISPHFDAQ